MRWLLPLILLPVLYAQSPYDMYSGDPGAEDKHRRQKTSKMLGQCPDGHQTLKDIPIHYGLHGILVKDQKDWNEKDRALAKLLDDKKVVLGTDVLSGGEPRFQPTCLTCGYYYTIRAVPDFYGSWRKTGKKFLDFKTEFSPLTRSVPFATADDVLISVTLAKGKVESESVDAYVPTAHADEWLKKVNEWLDQQGYPRETMKDLRIRNEIRYPQLEPFHEGQVIKGENSKFWLNISRLSEGKTVQLNFDLKKNKPASKIPETETKARGGLQNVDTELTFGESVRIAYLGGSITEAAGWRVLSLEWLREQNPAIRVEEINASISGTNSAFGAFRLGREVIEKKPDLLFVEFVMNDGSTDPQRTTRAMEGIVRQMWKSSPTTDICFVYTIGKSTLPFYQGGSRPPAVEAMEKVADHYGVPSIDFGPAIAEMEKSGDLTFTAPLPSTPAADGKIIFSGDGVHPYVETGHPLYLAAIQRSWPALSAAAGSAGPHQLPAPLDPAAWQQAALIPMKDLARQGNWRELATDVPPMKSAGTRAPLMWYGEKPGDVIEFSFTGTCFGLYALKGPDCGTFRVTVDSLPPIEAAKFDSFCVADRWRVSPWIYPQDLPNGLHRVRIEMTETAPDKKAALKDNFAKLPPAQRDGTRLYVSDVMIIGKPER
jgi:hypothetical protein